MRLRALVGVASMGLALACGMSRAERDRDAVRHHLDEMVKLIRAHDARIWLHVEAGAHEAKGPAHQALHQSMLRDFERLGRLDGFGMKDIRIEVTGDTASAHYRIEGTPMRAGERAPAAGELRLARRGTAWVMVSHRLIEMGVESNP